MILNDKAKEGKAVTLEDLLSLKRAERPAPEFWATFERELRQKQLTALVEKRRWWHDLSILLSRKVYVPAGAVAVIAFTLISVRQTGSHPTLSTQSSEMKSEEVSSSVETLPVTEVAVTADEVRHEVAVASVSPANSVHDVIPVAVATREVSDGAALLPAPPTVVREISPSARSIAANLARLEQSEPELLHAVIGTRLSPAPRVQTASVSLLESDRASTERYGLISRYAEHVVSPEPVAPAMVRERLARRLGDDLNDRISRLGVGGSQVSLKF